MGELNDKQRAFCAEYVIDHNGTQSAIRAGYSEDTAYAQASRLLKDVKIQEEIARLDDEAFKRRAVTRDTILAEIQAIWKDPEAKNNDRLKALELYGKELGMFNPKVNVEVDATVQTSDIMQQFINEMEDDNEHNSRD